MTPTLQKKWNAFLAEISTELASPHDFNMWFKPIVPVKLENNTLTIRVPSDHFCEHIETNYIKPLSNAIWKTFGEGINLNYEIVTDATNNLCTTRHSEKDSPAGPSLGEEYPKTKGAFKTNLDNRMRMDNFYQSVCNRMVYNAAMSIISKPGYNPFNPLFIHGASGVGKTHILHAIGNEIIKNDPTKRVIYVPTQIFKLQYVQAVMRRKDAAQFLRFYQNIDVLLIDDIQEIENATKTQNAFFQIFNNLKSLGKQIIITSDRAPVELEGLEERLYSRVKCGLTAEIERPDPLLRKQILETKMYENDIDIPNDVFKFIIKHADQNIRDIEGILTSLKAHSVFSDRPIDMSLAQMVVSQTISLENHSLTIKDITKAVTKYFNVEEEDIKSKSRKRTTVLARQFIMYITKEYTDLSLSSIGNEMGRRDHSTVVHSLKTVKNLLETDSRIKQQIEDIISLLNL